jgi:predicted nucleic acid-binding Zn ribbon protein
MSQKYKSPFIRNKEATKLDSAIEQMFDAYKIKSKTDQTSIITMWEELMGKTIASRTTKMFFKGKILYVELSSAPLKQELTLAKEKILTKIAEKISRKVIEDIVFR